MKNIILIITLLIGLSGIAKAQGVLATVYLNPVSGNDAAGGNDPNFPVLTWDKALSLAANNATIYVTWGSVAITSNTTINGNQYGASNITVMPFTGYTGALFTVAGGATGTISNITLKGAGIARALLSVNNGGTLSIGSNMNITDGGRIAVDGGANAINLTATPQAGMNYQILTTYQSADDEGRAIVNAGGISNPLTYFTLIEPASTANIGYELGLDGTTIRLYELPVGGIYLDPLNGNDAHSGAKSSRPLKTLARARALWNTRNTTTPGIITDIYVITRITLTANTTLDGGIKLTRFTGDADRSTTNTDYIIVYTGLELTINNATIDNSNNTTVSGTALYSESYGELTLDNGATILSGNSSQIIYSGQYGKTTVNAGSTITSTSTSTSAYCIYSNNNSSSNSASSVTINGGTITTNNAPVIYKNYGTLTIHGGTINHSGTSQCIYNYYGTMVIDNGTITTSGSNAIYSTYSPSTINGGTITNTSTVTTTNTIYQVNSSSSLTINGGTINAGVTTAIYNSSNTTFTLNKCNITSSNTTNGAVFAYYGIRINGEDAIVNGIINMANNNLESYPITVLSNTVTQNYTVRVADNSLYTALVRTGTAIAPIIDLGPYLSRFTLEPKPGYQLVAYANKGEARRNLVLYNTNGIYVNDFTGNDANSGTSPDSPVKTLANAAGKTSSTRTMIYICDSTLTINAPQNINQTAVKDTIASFLFRRSAYLMNVTSGGSLSLGNIAIYTTSSTVSGYINMTAGATITMNAGAEIMTASKTGINQSGGDLTMKSGSLIKFNPTTGATSSGTGINASGATSTVTLESGAIIERIWAAISMSGAGTLTIGDNVIIQNCYYAIQISNGVLANIGSAIIQNCQVSYNTVTVNNSTMNLNGTIIRNSSNQALMITGVSGIVNMTDGQIVNNGSTNTSYQGAVYVQSRATFNFSGGFIGRNNKKSTINKAVYGEQIFITSGGLMNFTGGRVVGNQEDGNAIYVHASGTTNTTNGHLTLSNEAVIDSGFIYCNSPIYAPIDLSNTLAPGKIFNINLGDNMAGCVLVDGSLVASSVNNFVLNTDLTTLSLSQSGNDVVVGTSAIYLDGVNGIDTNDGSSAALAVRTFKRARERLYATTGNYIIVIGTANLNNTGEIEDWDLNLKPNAVVLRGLGFTGYMVNIPSGKHLKLSNITLDGNKDVMNISVNSIVQTNSGSSLTINNGTKIQNNQQYGIYANYGKVFMNGGEICNNQGFGLYLYYGARTDSVIITGGSIHSNSSAGIYNYYGSRYISITGGEIRENNTGISSTNSSYYSIFKIGGTAKINENNGAGISFSYLDSLIIEGAAQINNNTSNGIYTAYCRNVLITGGEVKNNASYGLSVNSNINYAGNSFRLSGMEISGNSSYGLNTGYYETLSITNAIISNNNYGISSSNGTNLSISQSTVSNNRGIGIQVSSYSNMSIKNVEVKNNTSNGLSVTNSSITLPGVFELEDADIELNNGYGISINGYVNYDLHKNINILGNRNSGIYSNSFLPSSISGNVIIKGNRATNGGGINVNQGTVNISGVTLEADTCTSNGGGIYVAAVGNVIMSDVKIKDCVNTSTSTGVTVGGSAIYALGRLSFTDGEITGSKASGNGTVLATGTSANVRLTGVKINDNTARQGAVVFINAGGQVTLDRDTIYNNTTTILSYTTPVTGDIHHAGGVAGRLSLRDRCEIDGVIFINSTQDSIFVDEALLSAHIGAFHLLARSSGAANSTTLVTQPGTIVVSPNGTTVSDASQFLLRFTLVNQNIGRGLDKGGTEDKHIIIVNQFFIDGTRPAGGNGANPLMAFNSIAAMVASAALNSPYTTIWVSGPVTTSGNDVIPAINTNNVNLRRYTGFNVAAQPFPAYDSVMFTINPGASLTINGGNSLTNNFTVSGEGGSSLTDASIFKNNGTLTIQGYTTLFFNPTGGNGGAIYQNGTFNLSGNVEFNMYSTNTVYLAKDKVINIPAPLNSTRTIGITVETSPENTHIPGRVIATGTTSNVPSGMENLFVNELAPPKLPIGRRVNGSNADIMFYIADRNVGAVPPIYTTLQDAFDEAISTNNEEVRLYGNTAENVIVNKTLRYNSQGNNVVGSFILDSTSVVRLLDNLHADTLYIRATTFAKKAQLDLNTYNTSIIKAAYLDLRLPGNAALGEWYPINLPFNANVSDIRDASDTTNVLSHMDEYTLAAFDGQRRANHGIGNQPDHLNNDWQYFTGATMDNGTGYMVASKGVQTLRFKAANLNLFSTTTAPVVYYTGVTNVINHGINYVAQPMSMNSRIAAGIPTSGVIQVSQSYSSDRTGAASYLPVQVNTSPVIAPYTNYFYQAGITDNVSYTTTNSTATVRSGQASTYAYDDGVSYNTPSYYEVRLYDDNSGQYDALFVSANEYASKDKYEIGRDVIKMGTLGISTQLWSSEFDVSLCANEALLENGKADIPMFVNTPVTGKEYTLRLNNVVNDREQLWLCRNGKLVQNLTKYPEYIIEGSGGATDEYSLRITSGLTVTESVETGEVYVYTENGNIVIAGLHPGDDYMVYDMSGRLFTNGQANSNHTKIRLATGAYTVKTNGKTYKAVVK